LSAAPRPWRCPPLLAGSAALHALALPVLAAVPGLRAAAVALMIADHAVLMGAGMLPRSRSLGPNLRRMPAGEGRVALTFDDGPDPEVTPRVLDLLEGHGARASFFCVGELVERHPGLTREIARRRHRVENHTHRHLNRFSMLGPGGLAREIDRAQEAIAAATGRAPELFRPPAGIRSPLLEPLLAKRGLWLASWTRRGFDTVRSDPDRVLAALVRDLADGDVLLLHDGRAARTGDGEPVVLRVLPRLLERLDAEGLAAVPLPAPPR
jgi:peptidoglycan-N-acetylglucosamine deacetylase